MAKKFKHYKTESRKDWGTEIEETVNLTLEQVVAGAHLRMADSLELIAKNKQDLENRDYWKRIAAQQDKTISSQKGQITKLKNQLKKLQA